MFRIALVSLLLCGVFGTAAALSLQQQGARGIQSFKEHSSLRADPHVQELFNERENISVIVVGTNDGSIEKQSNNPMIDALTKINVRALMVEANPLVFKTLEKNLKTFPESQRLQPLNVVVSADCKDTVPFYVVSPNFQSKCPTSPHWAKYELSSMSYNQISKHWQLVGCGFQREEDFQAFIEEIQVPCWTPSALMGKDGFKPQQIDFLLVDAEGFDYQIVTAFMEILDFEPKLIIYEKKHLAGVDESNLEVLLQKRGYETHNNHFANELAVHQ